MSSLWLLQSPMVPIKDSRTFRGKGKSKRRTSRSINFGLYIVLGDPGRPWTLCSLSRKSWIPRKTLTDIQRIPPEYYFQQFDAVTSFQARFTIYSCLLCVPCLQNKCVIHVIHGDFKEDLEEVVKHLRDALPYADGDAQHEMLNWSVRRSPYDTIARPRFCDDAQASHQPLLSSPPLTIPKRAISYLTYIFSVGMHAVLSTI